MKKQLSHPTSNGSLPSFRHPRLNEVLNDLDLVYDCWEQLRFPEQQRRHLIREPGEPDLAYRGRLQRASYPSYFRDGIDAFAGALSRFELRNAPKSLIANQNDIDGKGTSLKAWFMAADAMVMRDNGCLLMVDAERSDNVTRYDDIRNGNRPFFSYAERRNVLNWRTTKLNGKKVISAVTILEWHEEEVGQYGMKLVPRYRVMKGGEWKLLKIKEDALDGNNVDESTDLSSKIETVDEGEFIGYGKRKLQNPPVQWYGHKRDGIGEGAPMLLSVAKLTLDWYRSNSQMKELLRACAMPVAVIKDKTRQQRGPNGERMCPPLVLGPNTCVEIYDENGNFSFAEASGSSLETHIQAIKEIEANIDRSLMNFVFSGSSNRTATEVELQGASIQANLTSLTESKESAMQSLYELWCIFTGETLSNDAGIDMLASITQKEVDNETLTMCSSLYDKGLMMRETFLALAQRRGLLRPKVDAKKEAALLLIEDEKNNALLNPPAPSPNDLAGDDVDEQGLPVQ